MRVQYGIAAQWPTCFLKLVNSDPNTPRIMYPTLYHAVADWFGIELQFLKLINTFGFLVALAFMAGARVLSSELSRREALGLFPAGERKVYPLQPPTIAQLVVSGLMSFLVGFKFFGVALGQTRLDGGTDTQGYLLSSQGHVFAGLCLAAAWVGYRYWEGRKLTGQPHEPQVIAVTAADHTLGITGAAALGGLIGAKVFHWLERPESIVDMFRNPSIGAIFSGLTIYGGLIVGTLSVYRYSRKAKLPFVHVADSVAPCLMLAYGVGRMGCQLAGDGDWGIVSAGTPQAFAGLLPDSFWAYDFPNNVLRSGVPMVEGGFAGYGRHLVPAVYPTPLYESLAAFALFGFLWAIRKRLQRPLLMFATYMMVNGVERFWIEKIRVNATYDFGGWQVTQAQIISVLMFLGGGALLIRQLRQPHEPSHASPSTEPVPQPSPEPSKGKPA